MSKTRQRCKSKRYNIFIHEVNKIQMMLKESNQLVPQKHMHMERAKIQYVRKKRLNVTILMKKYKNVQL